MLQSDFCPFGYFMLNTQQAPSKADATSVGGTSVTTIFSTISFDKLVPDRINGVEMGTLEAVASRLTESQKMQKTYKLLMLQWSSIPLQLEHKPQEKLELMSHSKYLRPFLLKVYTWDTA